METLHYSQNYHQDLYGYPAAEEGSKRVESHLHRWPRISVGLDLGRTVFSQAFAIQTCYLSYQNNNKVQQFPYMEWMNEFISAAQPLWRNLKTSRYLQIFVFIILVNSLFRFSSWQNASQQKSKLGEQISMIHRRQLEFVSKPMSGMIGEHNMFAIHLNASSEIYKARSTIQQPALQEQAIRIWRISNKQPVQGAQGSETCVLINSLNYVSAGTIETALTLLSSASVARILLVTRQQYQLRFSEQNSYTVSNIKTYIDSDYQFINRECKECRRIAYLFGNYVIDRHMAENIKEEMQKLETYSLIYSSKYRSDGKTKNLKKLTSHSLQRFRLEQFYSYLYLFKTNLFEAITPLNFAYYAKYNLEEILLLPVLAIVQESGAMTQSFALMHSLSSSFIQNMEFSLKPPQNESNGICFVSYPTDPYKISVKEFQKYMESLLKLSTKDAQLGVDAKISAVVYFKYEYLSSSQLYQLYLKLLVMAKDYNLVRFRLRIRANKTVSTLAAYESVYQYCPEKSMVVTSRHNVEFHPDFAVQVLKIVSEKYHYIHTNFKIDNENETVFQVMPPYENPFAARRSDLFEKYFMHFQIYKSDFLKTNLFWVLKNQELDFYQTESPLVNLMMEQTRLEFEYINKTLVTVGRRIPTELEKMQISHVKSYAEYSKLVNNQLMPYKYNCLENPAYRRYAPDKMEKNIHQIWITDQPVPKIRVALHDTIKKNNPGFNVTLWRAADITKENFPATYQIVQKTFEHHKDSERSFFTLAADLLRYELIFRYGGLYVDFKMEGKKPLDNFLKYEVLYLDADVGAIRLGDPKAIGIGVMGSMKNSYHMSKLLYEIIFEENIKFSTAVSKETGGWNGRRSFTTKEFFTILGLGYQLLFPLPNDKIVNECGGENKTFDSDQTVYKVVDAGSQKVIDIGLPCKMYPEAYLISYSPLAKTWIMTKQVQLQALAMTTP